MVSPRSVVVRKIDPYGEEIARYQGVVVEETTEAVTLLARWESSRVDLDYMVLEPGDDFVEHFFFDLWYNIFEIYRAADGHFRGWYCNVTRPPKINTAEVVWYDLALDLFVSHEGSKRVLDVDEFEALALQAIDPDAWRQATLAWKHLLDLAERQDLPFSGRPSSWARLVRCKAPEHSPNNLLTDPQ